jgi:hypothetical protein
MVSVVITFSRKYFKRKKKPFVSSLIIVWPPEVVTKQIKEIHFALKNIIRAFSYFINVYYIIRKELSMQEHTGLKKFASFSSILLFNYPVTD